MKIEGGPKKQHKALILPKVACLSKVLQGVLPPTILSNELNCSFNFFASLVSGFFIALSSLNSKSGSLHIF